MSVQPENRNSSDLTRVNQIGWHRRLKKSQKGLHCQELERTAASQAIVVRMYEILTMFRSDIAVWMLSCHLQLGVANMQNVKRIISENARPILVGSLLSLVFITGGAYYLHNVEKDITSRVRLDLEAIGSFKKQQLNHWRPERWGDAYFLHRSVAVGRSFETLLGDPSSSSSRQILGGLLGAMFANGRYAAMYALAPSGAVLLTVPAGLSPSFIEGDQVERAITSATIVFSDLQKVGNTIRMNIYIPIHHADTTPEGRTLGLIVLQIDPDTELYEIVREWPVADSTAEIILFRRDGDDVLYLNDFRNQEHTALVLRRPIASESLPAAWGLRGNRGIMTGVDYRGRDVVAFVDSVPNSPWFIVAKTDYDVLYREVKEDAILVIISVLAGVVLVFVTIDSVRREGKRRVAEEIVRRRDDLAALRDHLGSLYQVANDAVFLTNQHGMIIEVNDRAKEWYGYPEAELMGLGFHDLGDVAARTAFRGHLSAIRSAGRAEFECTHVRKNGQVFSAGISARQFRSQAHDFIQWSVRDISIRVQALRTIEEQSVRLRRIADASQDLLQAEATVTTTAQTIVKMFGRIFQCASNIRLLSPDGRHLEIAEVYAPDPADEKAMRELLSSVIVGIDDPPLGSEVFQKGRTILLGPEERRDLGTSHEGLRSIASRFPHQSLIAAPLTKGTEKLGILVIAKNTAVEPGFTENDLGLATDLATRASFALARAFAHERLQDELESRKRAERILQASEERFKGIFESANVGKSLTLPSGEISVNKAFCEMLGYEQDELAGKRWQDLTPDEEVPAVDAQIAPLLTGEKSATRFEKRYLRKDGAFIWADVSVSFMRDDAGKPLHFITTVVDISAKKEAQQALAESEERLRLSTELANVAVWEYDFGTNSMSRSRNHDALYGLPWQEHWDIQTFLGATHPDDRDMSNDTIQRSVAPGGPEKYSFDFRVLHPDGSVHWLEVSGQVVERDEEGHGLTVRGCLIDITRRKVLEEEIRTSEARFANIFALSPIPISISTWDDATIVDVNDAWSAMSGFSKQEVVGRTSLEIGFIREAERKRIIELFASTGEIRNERVTISTKQGKERQLLISLRFVVIGGRSYSLFMSIDATEWLRAEAELHASEEKYRLLFENSNEAMLLTRPTGEIVAANPAACRLFRWTEQEIQAAGRAGIVDESDPRLAGALETREREGVFRGELRMKRGDGSTFPGHMSSSLFTSGDGAIQTSMQIRDLSGEKEYERQLRKIVEDLNKAQHLSKVGSWTWNIAENRVEWSDQMFEIFGISRDDFAGDLTDVINRAIHPEDRPRVEASNVDVVFRGKPTAVEYRIVLPDGTHRHVWAEGGELETDRSGRPTVLKGYVQDITERKRAEETLRESEERYRLLVESAPNAIAVHQAGRVVFANQAAVRLMRAGSSQDLLGRSLEQIIAPGREEAAKDRIARMLKGEKGLYPVEDVYLRLDGSPVDVEVIAAPFTFSGRPAIQVIMTDLTEHKRAAEALSASEERYRSILQTAQDGFWRTDLEGRLLEVNAAYCGMSGYAREELLTMRIADIEDLELHEETLKHIGMLRTRGTDRFESRHCRKDGTTFEVDVNAQFRDVGGGEIIVFIRDITDRKRTERMVLEQLDELKRWHALTVGRESRVLELKSEVNELLRTAGRPAKYAGIGDLSHD